MTRVAEQPSALKTFDREGKSQRSVVILGSTGSIGVNALEVVRALAPRFRVVGLSTDRNVNRLAEQVREFSAPAVAVLDQEAAHRFRGLGLQAYGRPVEVYTGVEGLIRLVRETEGELVLSGVVGAGGLKPLLAALKGRKVVALANKEPLVMAGELVIQEARRHGATIIPVDSEHSAIFQCLQGARRDTIRRVILTASGGPFYRRSHLEQITVQEALAHPTWKMGKKITIDSATLMNKGFEAIEAHHLFGLPMESVEVLIHPQSIVHSLVEFIDGAVLAQLSRPDMRLPIQYALTYPDRVETTLPALRLEEAKALTFEAPDFRQFPCLQLALEAGRVGGTSPTVLNAANEVAVAAFLAERIPFTQIAHIVARVLGRHVPRPHPTLEEILEADREARDAAQALVPC
ncbi:MAG: 1-deoxy-D-xylulose-5-phosphate reductoisomerase [Elusimicrobia bacterium]|nr:1-deoxy-D-xylulose-5-phosphate reductoisomerase [Elusimicrobiota bacterium]